mmetsp:Transcript_21571/g.46920  ORF Transcript_21571/g.46920 Transcript_21571/m.46920 type:complete len:535 (+) Transcript_21571:38-1642(+)|eukprot:CAMPEP_0172323698 /NCGR_PEP_ID=MMETSP1058-20130122/49433_1 /TAXON_ID=83371 /ORGANISM="Detonula confervacea, Strain CCMP 353" /LENGTH=534 /DNA_ID=CAMNT_0013039775 /DNA_START=4 /DNA_END=1608 /DNA_ORIENTATION=-
MATNTPPKTQRITRSGGQRLGWMTQVVAQRRLPLRRGDTTPPSSPPLDDNDADDEPSASPTPTTPVNNMTSSSSSTLPKKSSSHDSTKDVLYARGAAAQIITNPGNLYFYQLCEERYDEFTNFQAKDPQRRIVAGKVVDSILASGGVFRKVSGGIMSRPKAIDKTRDRMRQIGKPKFRPTGFGENDVVSVKGAAVHLYPGNAKWHALVDGFVLSYYRDLVSDGTDTPLHSPQRERQNGNSRYSGRFQKGVKGESRLPSHKNEIIDEVLRIIHSRGGKFLDEMLNELTNDEAAFKTSTRFKDVKKLLVNGTKEFVPYSYDDVVKEEKNCDDNCFVTCTCAPSKIKVEDATTSQIIQNRLGGFTTAKNVVSSKRELTARQRPRPKRKAKQYSRRNSGKKNYSDDDDDDDISFQSTLLYSDGSSDDDDSLVDEDGDEGDADGGLDNMMPNGADRQAQGEAREERLKRRGSRRVQRHAGGKQQIKRRKIRRSSSKQEEYRPPSPEHPLSEYELFRLEKIKRNQAKLAELGLLTNSGRI